MDFSFKPRRDNFRKEMCMVWRSLGRNISFRRITPSHGFLTPRIIVRIAPLHKLTRMGSQETANGTKIAKFWLAIKRKRLLMNFARACQDHSFAARIQAGSQGTTKGMKMENACWVKNYKRHLCEFSAHLPGLQFCHKDPSWDPKAQPKEWA